MKLIKTLVSPFALALMAAPLAAQEEEAVALEGAETSEGEELIESSLANLGETLEIEPLTPEQEARLPIAKRVAAQVLPEGAMAEMMDDMMTSLVEPMWEALPSSDAAFVAIAVGLDEYELDLSNDHIAELAKLFDPARKERREGFRAALTGSVSKMVANAEPVARNAMAEVYAIRFSALELAQLETFFATDTGAKFARESIDIATDPRMLKVSFEAGFDTAGMGEEIEQFEADLEENLPPIRTFSDLTDAEKVRVSEITGLSIQDIEAGLEPYAVEATESYDEEAEWVEEEAVEAAE